MALVSTTKTVSDIIKELKNIKITDDTTMIELLNASFIADKDYILRKPNKSYIDKELKWYLSQSLNVNDIGEDVPVIWKQVSSKTGKINSNYGWCIFSAENYYQYANAITTLIEDPNTRRATMIYNRPSMQYDYSENGMQDFMCTQSVQCFIRDNTLIYIVNMRSNDAVFGYNNDYAWHKYVYDKMIEELSEELEIELTPHHLIWNANSFHVYPRHFHLLENDKNDKS